MLKNSNLYCPEPKIIKHSKILGYLPLESSLLICGDAISALKKLPSNSIQCAITSPPYWGLRDYQDDRQIGLEPDFNEYIDNLILVFSELNRVLKDSGTLWLNIGDAYTSGNRKYRAHDKKNPGRGMNFRPDTPVGLKKKDLIGIPWQVAFALQREGWYLRSEIIWHKPNAMPESVNDRPYRSHEHLFLLSKSPQYYFDKSGLVDANGKPKRSVWTVNTKSAGSLGHNAVFPLDLIKPCIKSSTKENDFIIDPFFGSGTTGIAAEALIRKFVGIELNQEFIEICDTRLFSPYNTLFI